MKDDLLWVYEGLTEYLGEVLTARSGLQTPEQWRGGLCADWRRSTRTGRGAIGVLCRIRRMRRRFFTTRRMIGPTGGRGTDFYEEGEMLVDGRGRRLCGR